MNGQVSPQFKREVEAEVRRLVEQVSPYRGGSNPAIKPFEIKYQSKDGGNETAWTWGRNAAQAKMKVMQGLKDVVQKVTRVRLISPGEWNAGRGKSLPAPREPREAVKEASGPMITEWRIEDTIKEMDALAADLRQHLASVTKYSRDKFVSSSRRGDFQSEMAVTRDALNSLTQAKLALRKVRRTRV